MRVLMMSLLCLSTLAACQSAESLQREREQAAWERSLTPDQRIRLEEARLRALGMALSGGPIFKAPSASTQQFPAPMPTYGPRMTCFDNQIGGSVYTNCF